MLIGLDGAGKGNTCATSTSSSSLTTTASLVSSSSPDDEVKHHAGPATKNWPRNSTMTHTEIRKKFLDFFEKRGHTIVSSSSLLPDDPSVLFTTAGMQQFKKFYTDPKLAPSPNVVSIQKSMRTSDIDEVGDERHLTFFEMLGNFSFGGYFKKEAIAYAHEFIVKEM